MNQPTQSDAPILSPDQEPILFVEELVRSAADSRGIRIQERKIIMGVPPQGWAPFLAKTEFPAQDMVTGRIRPRTPQVQFEAADILDAFAKAMPLLMEAMNQLVDREEKSALAQLIKRGAAQGAHLLNGPKPTGG